MKLPSANPIEPRTELAVFHLDEAAAQLAGANVLGFKAWNLARMAAIGLRVPPAFALSTAWCAAWRAAPGALPELAPALAESMHHLERRTGLAFGGARRPLLVSVRSGAPVSMPGMMDTLLDVGLCDAGVSGLLRTTGNPRLVWDSYRRLVQSFAEVVHGAPAAPFDELLDAALARAGAQRPQQLDFRALRSLTRESLTLYRKLLHQDFPQNPQQQLQLAAGAVFDSWMSDKARAYRRLNDVPEDLGTAVTVQAMVFGNAGGTSGAGVAFTRDPASGERRLYLDFQFNAQGEDVVSGRHALGQADELARVLPQVAGELQAVAHTLEAEFHDLQEFEFTVQDGRLWLLQTRNGKRTPWAAVVCAVEQVREGLISPQQALARVAHLDLNTIARRRRVGVPGSRALAQAVTAAPGVVSGCVALDVAAAQRLHAEGKPVILVREDIATSDIAGIALAQGLLTTLGGRTSHAAVVARQMDKVCLVGCAALHCEPQARRLRLGDVWLGEGDVITLDGEQGQVWTGEVATVSERPEPWLAQLRSWASQ